MIHPEWRARSNKILQGLLAALILAYFLYPLSQVVLHPDSHQWDFHPYYYAAKAQAAGLNPYSVTARREVANAKERFPFVYPPQTLYFFRFFALFDFRTAYYLFLALKLLGLAGLFYLWIKVFLRKETGLWFYPFAFLALNSAIFADINGGNFGIFEQFGLWLGFYFLLKKRLFLFCLLVFIVANFRIFPLFFLVLLLFIKHRRRYLFFIGGLAAFGLTQISMYLATPIYKDFLIRSRSVGHMFKDPSSYGMFYRLLHGFGHSAHHHPVSFSHLALYLAFFALVILISWRAVLTLRSLRKLKDDEKLRILIIFSCVVYALIVPRFMPYSQIILIVPAWLALKRFLLGTEGILFFILISLQATYKESLPGMEKLAPSLWRYFPLFLAFGVWLLFLRGISRNKQRDRKTSARTGLPRA